MTSKHAECDLGVIRGNLEESSMEISSVVRLRSACLYINGKVYLLACVFASGILFSFCVLEPENMVYD